jgi:hypothetical protein
MRTIICADSLQWLPAHKDQGAIISSLPDASELNLGIEEYEAWFIFAARQCFLSASSKCPVTFLQTDRKHGGHWLSKPAMLYALAKELGWYTLWHKIELLRPVGSRDLYRPSYRHLVCFGIGITGGQATADVIPISKSLYSNGCGVNAAKLAVDFALRYTNNILDPFCGYGTIPFMAESMGADTTGIDIDQQCVDRASGPSPLEQTLVFAENAE